MLFGKEYAAVARLPDFRVNRVTDDHAEQNGQRKGAEARASDCRKTTGPQRCAGEQGGQRQSSAKCRNGRCLVGKVSAVITFSFVWEKHTTRWFKYKIDYIFIINRNKW